MNLPRPSPRVLNVLLTHQPPGAVAAMLGWWQRLTGDHFLVAYGGSRGDFNRLEHASKVFVDDPRLRTRDHTRQRQSYRTVFREATGWLRGSAANDYTHVNFAEFDMIPLVERLNALQLAAMEREHADVLGLRVARVDGTSHPHYLYHAHDPAFHRFWRECSVREDRRAVLTMFGAGSFWTRAAFEAVAGAPEPFPIYLELFLPTAAHHLGYRVRSFPDASARACIYHLGDRRNEIEPARARGAWMIHPVKSLW